MSTEAPSVPESCAQCPHIDLFHSTCSHPSRQSIVQELDGIGDICPVFSTERAKAMHDLEERLS
ncbi:hypothetical protein [Natrinema gelatinilyticum]|uniref:hypothetical protein n=1 Tax=Natrinema gelatinilyticum TaxID=2961571 RepID=UPI0020C57CAA|nr:hypothetical protein [Natrinema gelatinilyticum]